MSPTLFAPMLAVCSLYLSFIFILSFSSFLSSFPFIPSSCLPYPSLFPFSPIFLLFRVYVVRVCECAGMYAMCTHEEARENIVCLLCISLLFPWGRLSRWIGSTPFWLGWLFCFCPTAAMASTCNHAWLFYMGDGNSNSGFHICSVSSFAHWTASLGPHQVFYLFIFLIVFYPLKKLVMSSFQPRNPWLWILTGYQAYDFPLYVLVCAYLKKQTNKKKPSNAWSILVGNLPIHCSFCLVLLF